jgi:hypothetical protein
VHALFLTIHGSGAAEFVLPVLSQRDSSGLATHNNELKFRLQAMEQQAQLRDGEQLTTDLSSQFLTFFAHTDRYATQNLQNSPVPIADYADTDCNCCCCWSSSVAFDS